MDLSSWFGSNITLRLHQREISQLMESYPQLIPNITKVVEPLKDYKWRHSHGKQGGNNFYSDPGSFEKGVGQGGLGEAATSSEYCKCLFKVLINILGLFPSSMCLHVLFYACFNPSYIDRFCLIH